MLLLLLPRRLTVRRAIRLRVRDITHGQRQGEETDNASALHRLHREADLSTTSSGAVRRHHRRMGDCMR